MRKHLLLSLLALTVVGIPAASDAAPIDCTDGCAEFSGGAIWVTNTLQPTGSGVFEPFVRLHDSPDEDGHNTDGDLSNDEISGVHTHAVAMEDLDNIVQILGLNYYEFALDLGEPAQDDSLLSLDALKICTSDDPELTAVGDCPSLPIIYDLDAGEDRTVLLDYNHFGNGNGAMDLFVYIPTSLFVGAEDYFYLYSAFGYTDGYHSEGTYEEWAYRHRVGVTPLCPFPPCEPEITEVPEPASLLLMGAGLAVAGKIRSRRKKR